MKSSVIRLSLAVLAASVFSLSNCVVPAGGGYGGPSYGGGGYGPPPDDGGYGPPPDDGGGYAYEEAGTVAVLPVGAYVVVEGGERHWYHNGVCYRRGPRGYVILHKKPVHRVEHHDSNYRKVEPKKNYSYQTPQPHYEQHHEVQHHEEHHEALIKKNGHYYRKGPDGKLILVK